MTTETEKFDYVCRELLDFDESDLKDVKQFKWRTLRKLKAAPDLSNFNTMPRDGNYSSLVGLYCYIKVADKTTEGIYQTTAAEYEEIDHTHIRRQYFRQFVDDTSVSVDSKPPVPKQFVYSTAAHTVDYANLAVDDIKTTDFIRFTNFQLQNDDQIMQFYRDVYTQGWQYKVYVESIDAVDNHTTVAPNHLSIEAKTLIGQTLHTKFRQHGTIKDTYTKGRALLNSTRDGYEFLEQLLLIVHPKFASVRQTIKDIPKFSQFNDLYLYATALQQYEKLQNISNRHYDDIEMSTMFLLHLDDDRYEKAVESTRQKVENFARGTLPLLYRLPGIATTVSQHSSVHHFNNEIASATLTDTVSTADNDRIYAAQATTRRSQTRSRTTNRTSNTTSVYSGDCHACGRPNHHANDCFFLQKIQKAMHYIETNPRVGLSSAKHYQNNGQYTKRHDKVRTLQDQNFIDPSLNPDAFLDVVDDLVIEDLQCNEDDEE